MSSRPGHALPMVRRSKGWKFWAALGAVCVPALIAALLPETDRSPPEPPYFSVGPLPQDRGIVCPGRSAGAACTVGDFVRAYGLNDMARARVGRYVNGRIGADTVLATDGSTLLLEKAKCESGKRSACAGKLKGL